MREIRLYGSEGGGAVRSPYPYRLRALKGHQKVAQASEGQERRDRRPPARRPGSAFQPIFSSPPESPAFGRFGGRGRVRGRWVADS